MTVLHLVHGMDPKLGGVCQAVRTMATGLAAFNCTSVIVSVDAPNQSFLKDIPCEVYALGPARNPWAYSSLLSPWLENNLARFDTVIVHGLWLHYGYAAQKAIKKIRGITKLNANAGKIPSLLVMPHGMLDPYFQKAPSRKLKAARNRLYWKLVERKLIHTADGLLFTCAEEKNLARESFSPYQPQAEYVVGLGVEDPLLLNKLQIERSSTIEVEEVILFLSRIHEKKGVDLLIAGFNSMPHDKTKLVIAGPGLDTEYGKKIRTLATKTNPASIEFPGMLSGPTKWSAFDRASAFTLPSHQENFGIAVVEALACSKPVLISDQVNIWREIINGGGGLVAPDTLVGVQSLLKKWSKLTPLEKLEMGRRARKVYEEFFAVIPAAKKLLDAIIASQKK